VIKVGFTVRYTTAVHQRVAAITIIACAALYWLGTIIRGLRGDDWGLDSGMFHGPHPVARSYFCCWYALLLFYVLSISGICTKLEFCPEIRPLIPLLTNRRRLFKDRDTSHSNGEVVVEDISLATAFAEILFSCCDLAGNQPLTHWLDFLSGTRLELPISTEPKRL
jgi:hypothetical protein